MSYDETVKPRNSDGPRNGIRLKVNKKRKAVALPPAFTAQMWKPGQSGNPGAVHLTATDVRRLARENSTAAMDTIIHLMHNSKDDRVRLVAADKVLERAFGRPKEEDPDDRAPISRERILELLRFASQLVVPHTSEATEPEVIEVTPERDNP